MSTWLAHLPGLEEPARLDVPAGVDRLEAINRREFATALFRQAKKAAERHFDEKGERLKVWVLRNMSQRRFLEEAIKRFNAARPTGEVPIPRGLAGAPDALLDEVIMRGLLERVSKAEKTETEVESCED